MMKFFSTILFLYLFEFAIGQVPGTQGYSYKSPRAQAFTLSVSSLNFTSANVTARILNNGVKPVTTSGILWGFSVPTISSYTGITTNGDISGNSYLPIQNFPKIFFSKSSFDICPVISPR